MKISIITNLYPPFVRGGAEWLTYLIALELVKAGNEVSLITTAPKNSLKYQPVQLIKENGMTVYRFCPANIYYYLNANKYPKIFRLFWQIINLFNIQASSVIKKILIKEKPQAVITANLMGLTFLLPRLLRQLSLKHLHIVHDVQLLHPSGLFIVGRQYSSFWTKFYQFLTRYLFKSPQIVIFPSQWLSQEYSNKNFFPLSKKVVQPNPAPAGLVKITKPEFTNLKILYLGQAEEHKGIFWLVEALKSYQAKGWQLEIVIVGETGDRERLHKLVVDDRRFVIFDRLTQAEINKKYQAADVVIIPSLCLENYPVTIQYAFGTSTPVLAAKVGGIPELVKEGKTGWLFEAENKEDLLRKLDYLLNRPQVVTEVAHTITKHYQPTTLVEYIDKLLVWLNKS